MALPNVYRSSRERSLVPSTAALAALASALSALRISSSVPTTSTIGRRQASHQAQGRANGAKDGPGKRLGAKKTGGEYVVPGNILYKQRGTHWFPGDGCFMGRDHTIHAEVPGYVQYYRDPDLHPKRKYIGVVFERHFTLPQPHNAVRRRKLGMLAYQMPSTYSEQETGDLQNLIPSDASSPTTTRQLPQDARQTRTIRSRRDGKIVETKLTLRPGYQWRQANWEIGRQALESKAATSAERFTPRDRFAAWRKRTARVAKNAERRAMGRGGKKK